MFDIVLSVGYNAWLLFLEKLLIVTFCTFNLHGLRLCPLNPPQKNPRTTPLLRRAVPASMLCLLNCVEYIQVDPLVEYANVEMVAFKEFVPVF